MDLPDNQLYIANSGNPPCPEPPRDSWVVGAQGTGAAPVVEPAYRRVLEDEIEDAELGTHLQSAGLRAPLCPVAAVTLTDSSLTICVPRICAFVHVGGESDTIFDQNTQNMDQHEDKMRIATRKAYCVHCNSFLGIKVLRFYHSSSHLDSNDMHEQCDFTIGAIDSRWVEIQQSMSADQVDRQAMPDLGEQSAVNTSQSKFLASRFGRWASRLVAQQDSQAEPPSITSPSTSNFMPSKCVEVDQLFIGKSFVNLISPSNPLDF